MNDMQRIENSDGSVTEIEWDSGDGRKWGSFSTICFYRLDIIELAAMGIRYLDILTKILTVNPGDWLSDQEHAEHGEQWRIIEGDGLVVVGNAIYLVGPGCEVFIPRGTRHRIGNIGKTKLVFGEIGFGSPSYRETDITRHAQGAPSAQEIERMLAVAVDIRLAA